MKNTLRTAVACLALLAVLSLAPTAAASPSSSLGWFDEVVATVSAWWDSLTSGPITADSLPDGGDAGASTDPLG